MSNFWFATCRAGAEAALKREVAHLHGGALTPAYMRPQLITWKARRQLPPDFSLGSVFAIVSGRSLGSARDGAAVAALLSADHLHPDRLHVFPRALPEDSPSQGDWQRMDAIAREVAAANPAEFARQAEGMRPGEWVLDVIVGGETEPWFVGTHRHGLHCHPWPGAAPRVQIPPEAPSRAWLKMEQALAWAGLDGADSLRGVEVLELGSAPGGASVSLLQHGAIVTGVDTGAMAPVVRDFGTRFTQLEMSAGDLMRAGPSIRADVVASDINLEPNQVLHYLEHFCRRLRPGLLIATLKMNHAAVERQMPSFLRRMERFAPPPLRAKQLPANRSEVTVLAGGLAESGAGWD